jgi:hypothetical protein
MNALEEMSPTTGDISPRYAEKTPPHKLVRRTEQDAHCRTDRQSGAVGYPSFEGEFPTGPPPAAGYQTQLGMKNFLSATIEIAGQFRCTGLHCNPVVVMRSEAKDKVVNFVLNVNPIGFTSDRNYNTITQKGKNRTEEF